MNRAIENIEKLSASQDEAIRLSSIARKLKCLSELIKESKVETIKSGKPQRIDQELSQILFEISEDIRKITANAE